MAKQVKKYMAVTTASFLVMQLAACGDTESQAIKESSEPVKTTNTSENNNQPTSDEDLLNVHNSEMADACDEWQEGEDGSFECLDENSPYYAQHFFNGLMYATAGAMIGSAIYKSRNLKNGTDKDDYSRGSAGAATTTTNKSNTPKADSNGITTGGSSSTSTGITTSGSSSTTKESTTNSSTSNSSTSSGTNTNTNNTNSYSSGQRSYSNSSGSSSNNTSSSNSYSNSSSSGKSGFGSGGASRGGSSST